MDPKIVKNLALAQSNKVRKIAIFAAAAIFLLWLFFASTVTIDTGKIAVMTRFGKVTGQELGEGFHLKSPIDKANGYDIKVLKEQTEAQAASKDLQDVKSTLVINYRLEAGRISEIHRTIGVLYKEKLIDPAVQEVFKGATAKFDATQLITDRQDVKADAYNELVKRLSRYGIIVQDLSITNFSFSPEFSNAIEAKQVAAQEAERAKFSLEKPT
ncbi:prohibitin family protein [Candidatus Saccharibacteria bacterium]|nr:MAG: prohibitin family protein [Candidatus Saccharibacteria bacterium]